MQSSCAHYEMDDRCIGREFRVVYHSFTAAAANSAAKYHPRAQGGVFNPMHIGLRLNLKAMSHQRGTPK